VSRERADIEFRDSVEKASNRDLADVYYKWVRRFGWISWNIEKIKRWFK